MSLSFTPNSSRSGQRILGVVIGPTGPSGTIAVGTVTTGAAGSPATVTNVGTAEEAILDFGIPQGDQGIQGIQGIQGKSYAATSTSSQTIGSSGTKTFTTQSGLAYQAGTRVRAASTANPTTVWMEGVVTSYSSTTLVFTADKSLGSGTLTSWTLNLAGQFGADGAGDVSASASFTADNRLVRTDRPTSDNKNIQITGITVDDSNNVSGVGTLDTTGSVTSGGNIQAISNTPNFVHYESDGGVDGKSWSSLVNGGVLTWRVVNDANNASSNFMQVTRSGITISSVNFPTGLQFNGNAVLSVTLGAALTGGAWTTSYSAGTVSSGTLTPAYSNRNVQHYTNNGAHTLAPPVAAGSIVIDCTNGASAGTVTRSGFTKVTGDTLTTTNGHKFRHFITVGDAGSHCHTVAMQ